MNRKVTFVIFTFLLFSSLLYAQSRCTENVNLENIKNYTFSLPSTRKITPYGDFIKTPNFPVNIAYNNKYIGVITSGATKERYFSLLDKDLCLLNKLSFSPKDYDKGIKGDIYQGIYADKKGNFYIAGGSSDEIIKINFQNQNDYSIEKYRIGFESFPKDQYPYYYQGKWEYGFKFYPNSVVADKDYIYATGLLSNALVRIDQKTKEKEYLNVGPYPYQVISDGNYLIVSLWGSDKIVVVDKKSFKKLYDVKVLPKGFSNKYPIHPSYIFAINNSPYILISDSNIDKIIMVDIKDKKIVHIFNDKPFEKALQGSYPQGMDIYKNYLFVANAGNNDIAVFDLNSKKLVGFIPTGYYPTSIKVINNYLYVVSSKGLSSKPNTDHQWVGNMMKGVIQKIYISKALEELNKLTNISLENNNFDKKFLSNLEKENKKHKSF